MEYATIFETAVITFALIHAVIVVVASGLILTSYARHRTMLHIALVAISYIILTGLTAIAMLGQGLYTSSYSRAIALILSSLAFLFGEVGLCLVWRKRKTNSMIDTEIAAKVSRNTERIARMELALANQTQQIDTNDELQTERHKKQDDRQDIQDAAVVRIGDAVKLVKEEAAGQDLQDAEIIRVGDEVKLVKEDTK